MRPDVLFLQGPVGPFFSRFGKSLESRGFRVWKINFNGGDRLFWSGERSIDYTGTLERWDSYLERLIVNRKVSRIYLFGDCRAYHRIAREVAARLQVRVFVFEEGYIRPNYITLEEGGVNGHSSLIDKPLSLSQVENEYEPDLAAPQRVFQFTAVYSMIYYLACSAAREQFPNYRHHRPISWFPEGSRWIRSGFRRIMYKRRERRVMSHLLPSFGGNYFLCPLQVHCDMQVVVHSRFNSIEHFIGEVLVSFAKHASDNKAIVFKHHPMDRGYTDYTSLLANLAAELGISDRVFYVHDLDLPTLLKNAEGTVLINSTVGISSLFHGTPIKPLGDAVYDVPGLASQEPLDRFWTNVEAVDKDLYRAFRDNLVSRNQLNGNFYRRINKQDPAGIIWSGPLAGEHTYNALRVGDAKPPRLVLIEGGAKDSRDGDSNTKAA